MSDVIAFSVLDGVPPQAAFIASDAEICFGDYSIAGKFFLASRGGQVAACVQAEDAFVGWTALGQLAQRQQLSARAEYDDRNGLAVVTRMHLFRAVGGNVWCDGLRHGRLPNDAQLWWGNIVTAQMSLTSRATTLPVPPAARPAGSSALQVITIAGEIGAGANTARNIRAKLGNDRVHSTVLVNFQTEGGDCAQGLEIYRLLAEHPYAVFAQIKRANSMAAIIAQAADVRTIRPDGMMMLHRTAIERISGRAEAAELRRIAIRCERLDQQLAGILAARTGNAMETVQSWMAKETDFDAGTALRCGLVDAIEAEEIPAPRPLRAKFAPIRAPYGAVRKTR